MAGPKSTIENPGSSSRSSGAAPTFGTERHGSANRWTEGSRPSAVMASTAPTSNAAQPQEMTAKKGGTTSRTMREAAGAAPRAGAGESVHGRARAGDGPGPRPLAECRGSSKFPNGSVRAEAVVGAGRGDVAGALLAASLSLAPAFGSATETPTGDPGFLVPGELPARVVDGRALDLVFTEGPAVGCDGTVFFSDITWSHGPRGPTGGFRAGHILRYDPKTGAVSVFRSPSGMANGLAIDATCALLAAEGADRGGRRITRTDLATGRAEILADSFRDRPLNGPNDLTVDGLGRIWFTDPRYAGREPLEQDGYGVYRLDPDGSLERVLLAEGRPNGIALAPDGSTLYLAIFEPGERRLLGRSLPRRMVIERWTVGRRGELREGRVLVDFGEQDGADGLATDREGHLWAAVQRRDRPGIYAFDPTGRERAYVPLSAPTNLAFGRPPEDDVLWVTADRSLWRLRVGKRGHHLQ